MVSSFVKNSHCDHPIIPLITGWIEIPDRITDIIGTWSHRILVQVRVPVVNSILLVIEIRDCNWDEFIAGENEKTRLNTGTPTCK